jgi:poly(3-hydroxybutyrate) depolymerase
VLLGVLAGTAVAAPGATPAAVPVDGAANPACSLASTGGHVRRSVGGRSYLLYVPPGLAGHESAGVPLVVALHGLTSSGAEMSSYTGFSPGRFVPSHQVDADQRGYVVAYLDGVGSTWDVRPGSPDVTFVRQVIYQLRGARCIDPTRVHVTGHSMGSMLAQRVACDLADVVASVTAYATASPAALASCTPFRAISIGFFHGEQDAVLALWRGAEARDRWVQRNSCSATALVVPSSDGARRRWAGCDAGVEVTWHQYPNQSHFWPGNQRRPQMVDEMWQLWDAHPFPASECLPSAFLDVGGRHPFLEPICWLAGEGITTGWSDATFRPSAAVSRQSMSAFLFRLSGDVEPVGCTSQFPDVTSDHPFFVEVCWMDQQGITEGYDDGTFRPADPVRRQSMSAFLHRFEGEPPVTVPTPTSFPDVVAGHPFVEPIEWMAASGVSEGYDDGTFRPNAVVTRQAMAAFLQRVHDLP